MKTKMILIAGFLFAGLIFSSFQKDKTTDFIVNNSCDQSAELIFLPASNGGIDNEGIDDRNLLSVYPNPFKQNTTIMFEVVKSGWLLIEVRNETKNYSIMLFNGYKTKGHYRITFDGTYHSPGRYTVLLMMGNIVVKETIIKVADDKSGLAFGQ